MKKRMISLVLAATMISASLAGCGGGSSSSGTTAAGTTAAGTTAAAADATTAAAGDTTTAAAEGTSSEGKDSIVIVTSSDILSMDPYRYDEGPTNQFMLHIYEPLVMGDPEMKFQPHLAESWEQSEDGLTWTFHLRKGVKFHDGEEMNAEDVVASFNLASNPDSPSAFSSYTSTFESVTAVDDYTVEIKTNQLNPIMLFSVAQIYILKKENIEGKTEEEIAANVCGTGRYKFVEQVKEDHIDLTVNEEYWGELPPIKNVRWRPISNEATRTATMLTGDVDVTINVAVRDVDRLENTPGIVVLKQKGLREIYLNLDSREDSPLFPGVKNPMSDPKVREAMYLAIDEDAIIKSVMNGAAYTMNSIIPENYVGYQPVERPAYDPERSKQLLAEAGYPDGFEVTLDAPNDRYVKDAEIAQAVAGYFEKVGIKVNLNLMPKANFFSYIKPAENNSMLLMTGWSDSSGDGTSLLHDMLYTFDREAAVGTVNRGHYSNAEVDKLIDQAYAEIDETKRGEIVAKADQLAREDFAYIPLHFEQDTYAIKDTINYTPRPNNYVFAWEFSYK
ncbi:ABC transporter substrate-binding protein [Clostridium sp. MCC353]|uniref:ABC transporter substrate-binding protein n=1 Tax=Clostridium sp. MCC353 TaxID=2592646 RepID=UPI001C037FFC|nr:ABC transporter substrate-binding protein [Clostridium sp. MCC353]MBT9779097.1 ABC transporter substrate-binding protein [Clostridium sp. MCC353]